MPQSNGDSNSNSIPNPIKAERPLLKKSRTIADDSRTPHFPSPLFPTVRRISTSTPSSHRSFDPDTTSPNTMNIFQTSYSQFSKVTQVRFHCSLSLSPLLITKPVILGVAAAAHCRSDREKDRHGEKVRSGGDKDDSLLGDFLPCGWRGGRHGVVDDEFELELSLLILLSLPFIVIARAEVLLFEL
ncbi:hypothetical protein CsSME_00023043 [Camellia sinensis var. sinensis]